VSVTAEQVKRLREATGAGMMDCKRALEESDGDFDQAVRLLREQGLAQAAKRAGRSAEQGVVDAYIHFNNTVGVLVEVNCETDFVAKLPDFRQVVKDIALHIASPASPRYLRREDVPRDLVDVETRIFQEQAKSSGKPDHVIGKMVEGKLNAFYRDVALLEQPYVKDDTKTIQQLLDEVGARVHEKVAVRRFVRYKLGEELEAEGGSPTTDGADVAAVPEGPRPETPDAD
jgi:elongation factor Ts